MKSCLVVFSVLTISCFSTSLVADETTEKKPPKKAFAFMGTPEIDGKIDEAWKTARRMVVDKSVADILQIEAGEAATARVRVLWDEDHLYFLWNVKDSKLSTSGIDAWEQDSVEVFIDENNKGTTTYETDDAQYRVSCEGEISGQGTGYDDSNVTAVVKKTKMGYNVEMSVAMQAGKLSLGQELGIDFQVNDDAGDGVRVAAMKWHHVEDDSWEDPSTFGTLKLKEKPVPKAKKKDAKN